MLTSIHHISIICSNYPLSKTFYTEVLGLDILNENYRTERDSYKLDLSLNGHYIIELFSFPDPPTRISNPEAAGLRHLAFAVQDLEKELVRLKRLGVFSEPIRVDEFTQKRFTFISDPDDLPIELYETD